MAASTSATQDSSATNASPDDTTVDPELIEQTIQTRLITKYGTLYAADEEKHRRQTTHRHTYEAFHQRAEKHRLRAAHLATRNRIWAEKRDRNDAEVARLRARIEELQRENEVQAVAAHRINQAFEGDVRAWERCRGLEEKWRGYFALEVDEVEVEKPEVEGVGDGDEVMGGEEDETAYV